MSNAKRCPKTGRYLPNNGQVFRKSDIEKAVLWGLNNAGGVDPRPSKKIESFWRSGVVKNNQISSVKN